MALEEEFDAAVNAHLDTVADAFEAELASLLGTWAGKKSAWLLFEYDSPSFDRKFAVCVHLLLGRGEVGGTHWFLKDEAVVVPSEVYDDPKYEEIEPWGRASEVVEKFLVAHWAKVSPQPYLRFPAPV